MAGEKRRGRREGKKKSTEEKKMTNYFLKAVELN